MSSRQEQKAQARERRLEQERAEQSAATRRRRLVRLGAVAAVALVAVVAIVVLSGGGDDPGGGGDGDGAVAGVAESRAMLEGIPQDGSRLGDAGAPLVLTEYADLQCPFCRDYGLQVLPQIISDHVREGTIALELRLLRFIGPDSDRGARVAHLAAESDRMWDFVDLWYRNQGPEGTGYADDAYIRDLARAAGLDPARAIRTIESNGFEQEIAEDEAEAQAAGIESTPSFTIARRGGQPQTLELDALTPEAFEAAIAPHLEALR